jgi:hypothetical protein
VGAHWRGVFTFCVARTSGDPGEVRSGHRNLLLLTSVFDGRKLFLFAHAMVASSPETQPFGTVQRPPNPKAANNFLGEVCLVTKMGNL